MQVSTYTTEEVLSEEVKNYLDELIKNAHQKIPDESELIRINQRLILSYQDGLISDDFFNKYNNLVIVIEMLRKALIGIY